MFIVSEVYEKKSSYMYKTRIWENLIDLIMVYAHFNLFTAKSILRSSDFLELDSFLTTLLAAKAFIAFSSQTFTVPMQINSHFPALS